MIQTSTIKVVNETHGTFEVSSSAYQAMAEAYFGSVNQNRRVLAAAVSEAAGANYFDADEMTLLAVAGTFGWDETELTRILAYLGDDYVAAQWAAYAETGE